MTTVVIAGMVASTPDQGGATSAVLQWALGLRALGCHVVIVDPLPSTASAPATARSMAYLRGAIDAQPGIEAVLLPPAGDPIGMSWNDLREAARSADVLFNIAGMLRDPALLGLFRYRVYVDLDPAFTQVWHASGAADMGFAEHHRFLTVGSAIGTDDCVIPTCGIEWQSIRPPVYLPMWRPARRTRTRAFTTVANWRSYGSTEYAGIHLGQKAHSFRRLIDVPSVSQLTVEVALDIHAGDAQDSAALDSSGWRRVSPGSVARTPAAFRRYVRGSGAELGVAKTGYVDTRCGWISERSACYLAAGRPVVAQRTGFEQHIPTGDGLLGFDDTNSAAQAMATVSRDYARHRAAARALAEEHFDSRQVLGPLLEAPGART